MFFIQLDDLSSVLAKGLRSNLLFLFVVLADVVFGMYL